MAKTKIKMSIKSGNKEVTLVTVLGGGTADSSGGGGKGWGGVNTFPQALLRREERDRAVTGGEMCCQEKALF